MFHVQHLDQFLTQVPAALIASAVDTAFSAEMPLFAAWSVARPEARDLAHVPVRSGIGSVLVAYRSDSWAADRRRLQTVAVPVAEDARLPADAAIGQAMTAILLHDVLVLGPADAPSGVITLSDFTKPAAALWAFGVIASFEEALGRLVPSLSSGRWLEDLSAKRKKRLAEKSPKEAFRLEDALELRDFIDLGTKHVRPHLSMSRNSWDKATGSIIKLRNDLAHGRPLGTCLAPLGGTRAALERLALLPPLLSKLWGLVSDREHVWTAYQSTRISLDQRRPPGRFWVVSGQNPMDRLLPEDQNDQLHAALVEDLKMLGVYAGDGVGSAAAGGWSERMAVVADSDREGVIAVANRFGQRSIFEVDDKSVLIVEVSSGEVRGTRLLEPGEVGGDE